MYKITKKLLDDITKKLMEMSDEEFERILEENKPICFPDTCDGQCQGMGWCERAVCFREKEIPKIIEKIVDK